MLRNDIDREAYLRMCKIRGFEEAVTALITEGEVPGACHSSVGQEAAIVGACMALRNDDYVSGTHRSHGHPIGKGAQRHWRRPCSRGGAPWHERRVG